MVNCSVAHLFDHPPSFFKAFFSRPLVLLLFWALGPKCLGVKTSPCVCRGGGAVFEVLSCPFLSLFPPPPQPGEPAPGSLPRTLPAPSPAPPGKGRQTGGLARPFSRSRKVAQLSSEAQPQAGNTAPNGPQSEGRQPLSDHRPLPGPSALARRTHRTSETAGSRYLLTALNSAGDQYLI